MMKKTEKSRKLWEMLLARHAQCQESIKRLRSDISSASDVIDYEEAVAIASQHAATLAQIEAFNIQAEAIEDALSALEEGTYGRCHGCGGSIPLGRLHALPFAKQCIECQGSDECRS
jgi:DnaK suppressor protein